MSIQIIQGFCCNPSASLKDPAPDFIKAVPAIPLAPQLITNPSTLANRTVKCISVRQILNSGSLSFGIGDLQQRQNNASDFPLPLSRSSFGKDKILRKRKAPDDSTSLSNTSSGSSYDETSPIQGSMPTEVESPRKKVKTSAASTSPLSSSRSDLESFSSSTTQARDSTAGEDRDLVYRAGELISACQKLVDSCKQKDLLEINFLAQVKRSLDVAIRSLQTNIPEITTSFLFKKLLYEIELRILEGISENIEKALNDEPQTYFFSFSDKESFSLQYQTPLPA